MKYFLWPFISVCYHRFHLLNIIANIKLTSIPVENVTLKKKHGVHGYSVSMLSYQAPYCKASDDVAETEFYQNCPFLFFSILCIHLFLQEVLYDFVCILCFITIGAWHTFKSSYDGTVKKLVVSSYEGLNICKSSIIDFTLLYKKHTSNVFTFLKILIAMK